MISTLRSTAALLLSFLIAGSACAQQVDIPFHKEVLDNGLTVIVHEDHKAPVVAVNVWYHVGSKNEVKGRTGFAHLFRFIRYSLSRRVVCFYPAAQRFQTIWWF